MCVMLQRAAEAGALGALKDGLRIAYGEAPGRDAAVWEEPAWAFCPAAVRPLRCCLHTTGASLLVHLRSCTAGTRILAQVLTVLALGCPPLAVLLQQVCMLVLLPQPAALCASPLLADPLTRSRMGQAWFMLDLMPLPPSIGMLARPDAQNASASAGALPRCQHSSTASWLARCLQPRGACVAQAHVAHARLTLRPRNAPPSLFRPGAAGVCACGAVRADSCGRHAACRGIRPPCTPAAASTRPNWAEPHSCKDRRSAEAAALEQHSGRSCGTATHRSSG